MNAQEHILVKLIARGILVDFDKVDSKEFPFAFETQGDLKRHLSNIEKECRDVLKERYEKLSHFEVPEVTFGSSLKPIHIAGIFSLHKLMEGLDFSYKNLYERFLKELWIGKDPDDVSVNRQKSFEESAQKRAEYLSETAKKLLSKKDRSVVIFKTEYWPVTKEDGPLDVIDFTRGYADFLLKDKEQFDSFLCSLFSERISVFKDLLGSFNPYIVFDQSSKNHKVIRLKSDKGEHTVYRDSSGYECRIYIALMI
ncbi:hypothetical protein CSB11_01680 [Candidatus Campbellbacteria bacterium]|nr:MAG: hypothetical protein CSB11_01680 [Candidatus Campbellbacteria bacterium]